MYLMFYNIKMIFELACFAVVLAYVTLSAIQMIREGLEEVTKPEETIPANRSTYLNIWQRKDNEAAVADLSDTADLARQSSGKYIGEASAEINAAIAYGQNVSVSTVKPRKVSKKKKAKKKSIRRKR